jgi:hypothetical protein
VLLSLVALLQLIRALLGWEVIINGFSVPIWASVIVAVIAGGLALMILKESRR